MNWKDFVKTLTAEELELLLDAINFEFLSRGTNHEVWHRCLNCNGVGKHKGGYCTCSTGRDLRRIETGNTSYDVQPE